MAQKRKDLPVVHLEVYSSDSFFAVRVSLLEILYLEVEVFKLEAGDLRSHRLIILSV